MENQSGRFSSSELRIKKINKHLPCVMLIISGLKSETESVSRVKKAKSYLTNWFSS